MKLLPKSQGFTLIEFLLYMGILSFILLILTTTFGAVIDSGLEAGGVASTQQDGRYILLRLTYDLQRAQSIISPPLGATSSALQLLVGGSNVSYQLDGGGNMVFTDSTGSDFLNSFNASISGVTFQRVGNMNGKNSVIFSYITTSRTISQKGPEQSFFQSVVAGR